MADERTTVGARGAGTGRATLDELAAVDPERPAAVVRELTKLHEEVWRGTLGARPQPSSRHARCAAKWCWWWAAHRRPANRDERDVEAAVRDAAGRRSASRRAAVWPIGSPRRSACRGGAPTRRRCACAAPTTTATASPRRPEAAGTLARGAATTSSPRRSTTSTTRRTSAPRTRRSTPTPWRAGTACAATRCGS